MAKKPASTTSLSDTGPSPEWTALHKKAQHDDLRKLATFGNSRTFIATWPIVKEASKTFANVAGLIFAGSLTFLGLRLKVSLDDTALLQWSWIFLGTSVFMHLFVYMAGLDAHLGHHKASGAYNQLTKIAKGKDGNWQPDEQFMKANFRMYWDQKTFFRSSRYLIFALIFQVLTLLGAGFYMAQFIATNI